MGISLGSLREAGKVIAQNTPLTGGRGVNLLLLDTDFDFAVRQALQVFNQDKPNARVVDAAIIANGFRVAVRGVGALAEFSGANAWPNGGYPSRVWYPFNAASQGNAPMDANDYRLVRDPAAVVLEFLGLTLTVGTTLRVEFNRNHTLSEAPNVVVDPTVAPTAALVDPAVAGNVDNGTHGYVFTWLTADGETLPSPAVVATVIDKSTNGKVAVVVPASDDFGIVGVKVYRTIAGNTGAKKLVGALSTNGGTFTDNVADSSLGVDAPSANTAGGSNTVDDDDAEVLALLVASFILQMAANKAAQNTGNTNLPNDVVDRRSQSDIFQSRAKELRSQYSTLVGKGKDAEVRAASAFADLNTTTSDGRPYLWH